MKVCRAESKKEKGHTKDKRKWKVAMLQFVNYFLFWLFFHSETILFF